MTMQSGAIASRFRAVSSRVSPLLTLEVETLTLTASADKRLAAISKDVLVRVEGSKKRLMTVRPRSAGTFLIWRFETSRNVSAVSSSWEISAASSSRIPSRWRRLKVCSILADTKKAACWPLRLRRVGRPFDDYHSLFLIKLLEHHLDDLALLCGNEFADVISLNRQLAMFFAAIDQDCQLYPFRAAEVDQLIERGANRAAGVEHVVDQDDVAILDVAGKICAINYRFRADS